MCMQSDKAAQLVHMGELQVRRNRVWLADVMPQTSLGIRVWAAACVERNVCIADLM